MAFREPRRLNSFCTTLSVSTRVPASPCQLTYAHRPERTWSFAASELQSEVAERFGSSVELMKLKHGIFDDASVSVISLATIAGIGREAGVDLDRRRFRANIVLETRDREPFLEDGWVGGTLVFGDSEPRPAVSVTARDVRCMMINLDPDTGTQDARVLKTVVAAEQEQRGRLWNGGANRYNPRWRASEPRIGRAALKTRRNRCPLRSSPTPPGEGRPASSQFPAETRNGNAGVVSLSLRRLTERKSLASPRRSRIVSIGVAPSAAATTLRDSPSTGWPG